MVISLTTIKGGLMEGVDGTSININHLACTWRIEMKEEESIKEGRGNGRKGSKKKEETL